MAPLAEARKGQGGLIGQLLVPSHREQRLLIEKIPSSLLADLAQLHQRHHQDFGAGGCGHRRLYGLAQPL
jgi:hypothetical protein